MNDLFEATVDAASGGFTAWPQGAFTTEVGSFAKQSTTGNQDITINTDLTGAPAGSWAVIFWSTGSRNASGTWFNEARPIVGYAANGGGTISQYSVGAYSQDAITPSNSSQGVAAACISNPASNGASNNSLATLTGFVSPTTMRINWSANDGDPYVVNYMILSGLINAKTIAANYNSATTQTFTGVGFMSDLVFTASTYAAAVPSSGAYYWQGFGAFNRHGQQWANGIVSYDAANPTNTGRFQQTDACIAVPEPDGSIMAQAHFVEMNSDGFKLQWSNAAANRYTIFLCLQGVSSKLGSFTKTTTAAPAVQTVDSRQGFAPRGILFSSFLDTQQVAPRTHAYWNIGASDLISERSAHYFEQDAVATAYAKSVWSDDKVIFSGAGSTTFAADLSSVANDSYTLNFTTNDSNAFEHLYLVMGSAGTNTFPSSRLDSATTNSAATAHPNQKKVAVLASGRMVRVVAETTSNARFEWSDDGQVWTDYNADIAGWSNGSLIVGTVNGTEYLYVVWKQNGTGGGRVDLSSYIAAGTFASSQASLTWGQITNNNIGDSRYNYSDLCLSQNGTGATLHVFLSFTTGTTTNATYMAWYPIDAAGVLTAVTTVDVSGNHGGGAHTYPSAICIDNRIHVVWSSHTTGAGHGIRYRTGTVSGSTTTWATQVEVDASAYVFDDRNGAKVHWDAGRSLVVIAGFLQTDHRVKVYDSSNFTSFTQRVNSDTSAWEAQPQSPGSAIDPTTGDVYIFGGSVVAGALHAVQYYKMTRSGASLTIGPVVRTDYYTRGGYAYVYAFPVTGGIGWIYTAGNNSPYAVKYDRLLI